MIPKIIHYCWFGKNELPALAKKCIESWKKHCPDCEIIEWNEDKFDITCNQYVRQAYESKKYAFVSDYARFYIIYNYGGIYLDTDVEVLKPLDIFLNNNAFMGFESEQGVAPGLILGGVKGNLIIKEILDSYANRKFIYPNGKYNLTTVIFYSTDILLKYGLRIDNSLQLVKDIVIYPKTYFCPLSYESDKTDFSDNTYSIHHFAASWKTEKERENLKKIQKLSKVFGIKIARNAIEYCECWKEKKFVGLVELTLKKINKKLKIMDL